MIPVGDVQPRWRFPLVTYLLIALNVVFFLDLWARGPAGEAYVYRWGVIPTRLWAWPEDPAVLLTLVSSMFLHGGWFHLVGNMLYLGIFGDNVEDRLGHGRFLAFYLGAGVAAGLVQALVTPQSALPMIGASGAVAAVLGAYMVLFPHARVLMLVPLFFWMEIIAVPAVLALGMWFVGQFFSGLFSLTFVQAATMGGVAWWAHIGGFVAGVVVALMARKPQQRRRRPNYDWYDSMFYYK